MKKIFLFSIVFVGLLGANTWVNAECTDDLSGGWRCFETIQKSKASSGDCKSMNCSKGCVEAKNGHYAHCCKDPTKTDCRGNIYSEGCLVRTKVDCLPSQFCNKDGVCQNR